MTKGRSVFRSATANRGENQPFGSRESFDEDSANARHLPTSIRRKFPGGEGGIRTLGRVTPTHAFQACSFSHSDTSPDSSFFGDRRSPTSKSSLPFGPLSKLCKEALQQTSTSFFVDSVPNDQAVVEARIPDQVTEGATVTRFRILRSIDERRDPAVHQSSGTHGARLQRYVHRTADQSPAADLLGGSPDGQHLGMSQWISIDLSSVESTGKEPTLSDHYRADRNFPERGRLPGGFQSHRHPSVVVFLDSRSEGLYRTSRHGGRMIAEGCPRVNIRLPNRRRISVGASLQPQAEPVLLKIDNGPRRVRVLCTGRYRTSSGPEGSSDKVLAPGAADSPEPFVGRCRSSGPPAFL